MSTTIESSWENERLKEEIESLRQQLAAMTAERDAYMRDYGNEQDRKREVAQKLANREKQIVMLRGYLSDMHKTANHYEVYWVERMVEQALDATADLYSYVLCEREPVAEVKKHTGSLKDMAIIVWSGEQPAEGTKLYAPKGLKNE